MSTSRRQRLTVEDIGDVTVVSFTDKQIVDAQNIEMIGGDLFALVDEHEKRKLVLNFFNVEKLSTSIYGKFLRLHQRLAQVGGKLVLCCLTDDCSGGMTTTSIDKILKVVATEKDALAFCAA